MRLICVITERIKSHFKNHKVIVAMFLFGVFTSTLFFTYYYGDNVKSTIEQAEPDLMAVYEIQSVSGLSYDDERILELENTGTVTFYFDFELNKELSSDIFFTLPDEEETYDDFDKITCISRRNDAYEHEMRYGYGDLKSNTDGILLSYDLINRINIEQLKRTNAAFLNINRTNMQILGVHGHVYESCIPFKYVVENRLKADAIQIHLNEALKENEANDFADYLSELFPDASSISTAYDIYEEILKAEESTMAFRMQRAMLTMLLSVFTFMFLAKYLFDMSAHEDLIYRMIGTQRANVALIALGEIIIFALFAIILAIFTHAALFESVFLPMSKYSSLYFTASDYFAVGASSLFMCILACVPFLLIIWRRSAISAKMMIK